MQRIPGLDGLRGVAVLIVLVGHLDLIPLWPMYGVTVFFVLSGYLITGILLRDERPSLRRFYLRRAKRLLPALVTVLFFAVAAGWMGLRMTLPPLTYTTSFLAAAGDPVAPVRHTWSLAVEEHFYLLWPLALIALRRRPAWIGAIVAAAIGWRWWLEATQPWQRIYYSTDANMFAILLGCALAMGRHHGIIRPTSRLVGLAAVGAVVGSAFIVEGQAVELCLALVTPVAALAALAVNAEGRGLELGPLRWFGTISYGLYLWHWVIDYAYPAWSGPAVAIASAGVAWVSWTLIERPILSGRLPGTQQAAGVGPDVEGLPVG